MTHCGVEEEEGGWESMERDCMPEDGGVWSAGDWSAIGSENTATALAKGLQYKVG